MYGTLDNGDDNKAIITIDHSELQRNLSATTLENDASQVTTPRRAATSSRPDLDTNQKQQEQQQAAEMRRKRKIYSHCHVESAETQGNSTDTTGVDKSARRRLIAASVICLLFMIGEIVGGILSNSLAIATDAAHLLTDFASFMISLFAIWLSSRPATRKMSFGWYRAEVIGALLSVLMIWLVTGLLVYLAVERLRTKEFEIDSFVMVITAAAGLLVNIIMAIALNVDGHGHGHFHSHGGHAHAHGHKHDIGHHNHLEHLDDDEDEDNDDDDNEGQLFSHDDGQERNKIIQQQQQQHVVSIDCSIKTYAQQASAVGIVEQKRESAQQGNKQDKKKRCTGKKGKCESSSAKQADGRGRSNINVRAAFIHVIGDFLQSLGVLIAALVIHFEPSYAIVDPICTFLFSFIVLITTINIIRDAINVLMEGIPNGINFIEVREKLQSEPYVIRVHNLRIWSLSLDKIAISTHLVIDTKQTTSSQALRRAIALLKSSYNFFEVTIQIEEYREDMKDCEQCQDEDEENVKARLPIEDNTSGNESAGTTSSKAAAAAAPRT